MSVLSIILLAIAWLTMLGGICWYITIGTRKGEIDFMKGIFFIVTCIGIAGILLTLSFIVS